MTLTMVDLLTYTPGIGVSGFLTRDLPGLDSLSFSRHPGRGFIAPLWRLVIADLTVSNRLSDHTARMATYRGIQASYPALRG